MFENQLPDHGDEARVESDGRGPLDDQAELIGPGFGLGVEVVHHLHVVGDEADRSNDHGWGADLVLGVEMIKNVGFEPGNLRGAAAALEDERPLAVRVDPFAADSTGNPTARLSVVKQLTPSWTVILQTTLSGEREQIVVSRWYLAPGLFLEGAQHEDGSLSLDLKLRRPY